MWQGRKEISVKTALYFGFMTSFRFPPSPLSLSTYFVYVTFSFISAKCKMYVILVSALYSPLEREIKLWTDLNIIILSL